MVLNYTHQLGGKKLKKKEDKINEFSRVNKLVSDILEVDNGVVVELQLQL